MYYNIEMQLSALLFLTIIGIVFFVKVKRWTPDNRAFAKLVVSCFFMVISDIICPICLANPDVPVLSKIIMGKMFLIFLLFSMMFLGEYTISLTIDKLDNGKRVTKIHRFVYNNCNIIAISLCIVMLLLPLSFNNENGSAYIYGPAQYLCYATGVIYAIMIPLYTFINRKIIPIKKQLPLYAYVLMQGLATIIQLFNKDVLLTSTALVLDISMLYFTLQNPDIVLLEEKSLKEKKLVNEMVVALSDSVESKDHYTSGHSTRVAEYSVLIARKAGFMGERLEELYYMAMLHDIGKIGIPDEILNKNGKLTNEEFDIIKKHPSIGGRTLEKIKSIPRLCLCAKYHHERYDGSGYPDGLKGDEIPIEARIVGVADAYDAMTSNRSYRPLMSREEVRDQLVKGRGTQFDPKFLDIMLELVDNDTEYKMREQS